MPWNEANWFPHEKDVTLFGLAESFSASQNANAANVYCHGVNSIILGIQVSKPLLDKPNTMFLEMYPSFILYFMDALEDA